jgi:hypothetical protein
MSFSTTLMPYLTEDKDVSHLNFDDGFGTALTPFLEAAKEAGHDIQIYSGYRSPEHQDRLFAAAVKKYGSEAAARKWAAPAGKSRHNHGGAADLRYATDAARNWAHDNASSHGLNFRLSHEPWHIELNPSQAQAQAEPKPKTEVNPPLSALRTDTPHAHSVSNGAKNKRISEIFDNNFNRSDNRSDQTPTKKEPVTYDPLAFDLADEQLASLQSDYLEDQLTQNYSGSFSRWMMRGTN